MDLRTVFLIFAVMTIITATPDPEINKDLEEQYSTPPLKSAFRDPNDLTKRKKKVKFGYVEHKGFTEEQRLDDASAIRDLSSFRKGKGSRPTDIQHPTPESSKSNIQYEQSPVMVQPVIDHSIYQENAPKKDDAPVIRDYLIIGNVSPLPDIQQRTLQSPRFNIQYHQSPVMVQPVIDHSIHKENAPKKDNAPAIRDSSSFRKGKGSLPTDIQHPTPESSKSNIQYHQSPVMVQPVIDHSIYQEKAPKKDDAPAIRDYSIIGNVSPLPDIQQRTPQSPRFNVQYHQSPVMVQPVIDHSIHKEKAPKKGNLLKACLSKPRTD